MKKVIMFLFCVFSAYHTMASDSLSLTVHEDKSFYSDGNIKSKYQYVNINGQILHGEYKEYYGNGSIKKKGDYSFNRRVGEWKYFDSSGVVTNIVSYEESSLKNKDRIYENNANIQKAFKEIEAIKASELPEPYLEPYVYDKTDDVKRGVATFIGVLQTIGGTLGLIITIVDANEELTIDVGQNQDPVTVKNEWVKMHTVCLSLSITAFISGISTILIAKR